jgi:hypothetical protein
MSDLVPEHESPEVREARELQDEFDQVLKGKFDLIPEGSKFSSRLPNVDEITIVTPESHTMAFAQVYFGGKEGKERHQTFSIYSDGRFNFSGSDRRMSRGLEQVRKEDLYREVLDDLKKLGLDFWVQTQMEVAPPGEWPTGSGDPTREASEKKKAAAKLDPSRIEFLRKQPGVLFGHITQKEGFKDYRVFFFKDFAIIEHPTMENAAYFIDFDEPLDDAISGKGLSQEAKIAAVQKHWPDDLRLTKGEMRSKGFTRVVHQGNYNEILQKNIDERLHAE